jgi:hypothetical protein
MPEFVKYEIAPQRKPKQLSKWRCYKLEQQIKIDQANRAPVKVYTYGEEIKCLNSIDKLLDLEFEMAFSLQDRFEREKENDPTIEY